MEVVKYYENIPFNFIFFLLHQDISLAVSI